MHRCQDLASLRLRELHGALELALQPKTHSACGQEGLLHADQASCPCRDLTNLHLKMRRLAGESGPSQLQVAVHAVTVLNTAG